VQNVDVRPSRWAGARALAVHLYTASGAVLALCVVVAAVGGRSVEALWYALLAMLIDSSDGTLVRRYRVAEVLPVIDGRRLDDIVDFLTYVFAPVVLFWSSGLLPAGPTGLALAALPLLASCYQFCRVDAKTDDHFFLGFPSYWNVLAFYAVVQRWAPAQALLALLACSALVFVPIRYLYPSRTVAFRRLTLAVCVVWLLAYGAILAQMPRPSPALVALSLVCVGYYIAMSLYLTARHHGMRPGLGRVAWPARQRNPER
jgi:phosphatidylcholine synthase